MKRLMAAVAVTALLATVGCSSGSTVKLNMDGNDPLSAKTEATTTSATIETKETMVKTSEPSITKTNKIENVSGEGKFVYQGREWEGTLLLTESAFYFTPKEGEEVKFPLNSLLLVVVDYEQDATYETVGFLTPTDEFEFRMEPGFSNEISKYIIISEATDKHF